MNKNGFTQRPLFDKDGYIDSLHFEQTVMYLMRESTNAKDDPPSNDIEAAHMILDAEGPPRLFTGLVLRDPYLQSDSAFKVLCTRLAFNALSVSLLHDTGKSSSMVRRLDTLLQMQPKNIQLIDLMTNKEQALHTRTVFHVLDQRLSHVCAPRRIRLLAHRGSNLRAAGLSSFLLQFGSYPYSFRIRYGYSFDAYNMPSQVYKSICEALGNPECMCSHFYLHSTPVGFERSTAPQRLADSFISNYNFRFISLYGNNDEHSCRLQNTLWDCLGDNKEQFARTSGKYGGKGIRKLGYKDFPFNTK